MEKRLSKLLQSADALLQSPSYLVIPLTQELQFLGLLVHEDSLQVPCIGRPQLYGLFSPTHHLVGLKVSWTRRGELERLGEVHGFSEQFLGSSYRRM